MNKPKIVKIPFGFDPSKTDNKEVKKVFEDETARILWIAIKRNRLVDENFNKNILYLAKVIDIEGIDSFTADRLTSYLRGMGIIGTSENGMGDEIIPFLKKERIFKCVIKKKVAD